MDGRGHSGTGGSAEVHGSTEKRMDGHLSV